MWQRLTWWASAVGGALFLLAVIRWREQQERTHRFLPAAVDAAWMASARRGGSRYRLGWYNAPDQVALSAGMMPVYFTPPRLPAYFLFAGFVLGQLALVVILLLAHRHQGDDASSGTLLAAARQS
ncbi:MAG: hypothetical protein H6644_22285 [Caldilineaceae bacterium]|nr:hypothetical protein [Caldilineaceae bacterium]